MADESPKSSSPRRLGPYRIDRNIGQGGMGFVYEAWDTRLNRRVALKTVESGVTEEISARFRQEAKHSAKLRHPNIVSVHDIGKDGDSDYFVMDLVDGVTFEQWLKKVKATIPQLAGIMEKVARALHYAHQQGVIHRDMKPGNIMIDEAGEPQVMDFGLARNIKDSQNLTMSGSIVGTPAYMSPEQTMGVSTEVGPSTDLWGLGVILYEITTGEPPFDNGNVYQTIYRILHDEPKLPRKVKTSIPKNLETIILKCLQKQASKRYRDAEELANDLKAFREGRPIMARGLSWWEKIFKKLRHHRAISMDEFVLEQQARQKAESQRLELQTRVEIESKQEWHLVFEENFSDPDIESRWEILGEHWEIKNGELRIWGGTPQILYLRKKLSGDIRIEFECHQDGELLGDMSCFMNCLPLKNRKKACDTGYIFQYGAAANTRSFIERPKSRLWEKLDSPIVKGVPYRISAERSGAKLTWKVNDSLVCEVEDPEPLHGTDRNHLGIYGWRSDTSYRWIRIYALGVPIKSDLLMIAQRQLEKGSFEPAIDLFKEVLDSTQDPARLEQARKGIALAHLKMELEKMLPVYVEKVMKVAPKGRVELDDKGVLVDVRGCNLTDLEFIRGIPVTELICRTNQIEKLDPLAEISSLVYIDASDNRISDLSPLRGLNLYGLRILNNRVTNLEPLRNSKLIDLDVSGCQISDIEPLRGNHLVSLSLASNRIKNIEPLSGSPLKQLSITDNQVQDISPLKGLSLSHFYMVRNQISDLEPLRGMPLTDLDCTDNPIQSLKPFLDQPPPRMFFYNIDRLSVDELEGAISLWKSKGCKFNAENAEALLALKQNDIPRLKKLAIPFRGHAYLLITQRVKFEEACQIAERMGGSLPQLRSQEELEFVYQLRHRRPIWVGIISENGERKWITGEPLTPQEILIAEGPPHETASLKPGYGVLSTHVMYNPKDHEYPFMIRWRL
jgi:serine/threonine protein kinase